MSGGRTFPQCQEGLVNLCKSFAADLNNLVTVVPQGPDRDLVTTSDPNLQTSILN